MGTTSYALFLRGINVGAANRIKMADLVRLFGDAGFANARTYIQSGNVRAESALDAARVTVAAEAALAGHFKNGPKVAVIAWDRLAALVESRPFEGVEIESAKPFGIFLCGSCQSLSLESMPQAEGLILHRAEPNVLLGHVRMGMPQAFDMKRSIERPLGVPVTARFWNVVEDFVAKLD